MPMTGMLQVKRVKIGEEYMKIFSMAWVNIFLVVQFDIMFWVLNGYREDLTY